MRPSQATALGLLLAVGAAFLAHRFVLDLELMGWDSYPLIAASRIESVADLLGSFGEELMDGRYPGGDFYRPVTNLFFALDHALGGVQPRGYQRTNLLIQLAGVVAVFALGRRWLGTGVGCVVAALVFAVHQLQLETLPVAARRADMLFTVFLVLALLAQPLQPPADRVRLGLAALLVLLAAASKETGAVGLPVALAAVWILPSTGEGPERTRRTLRLGGSAIALFAGFLLLRTIVLGGIGGHAGSSPLSGAVLGLFQAPAFLRQLVMPQPWTTAPPLAALLAFGLVAALAAAVIAAAREPAPGDEPPERQPATDRERPDPARLAAFLGFWLLCLAVMTGVSGERASWYAVPFLPPYALLLGLIAEFAARELARPRRSRALAAAALVLLLVGSHLRYSALVQPYPEWAELSRQERDFLTRFRAAVDAAEPGSTVQVPALPLGTGAPLERVGIRSALCLSDYSVEAWAELALPDRPVRVRLHTGGPPTPPVQGVVTVDAVPLPSPALRLPPRPPAGSAS